MTIEIGHVEAIFRYPVKSMAGERVEAVSLGWHGIDGDRRLALRRTQERNDFPWLSATKLPDLLRFTPLRHDDGVERDLPTHVRTPEGKEMAVFGEELAAEIERRHRAPVHIMHLRAGIFDEASVSALPRRSLHVTLEELERKISNRTAHLLSFGRCGDEVDPAPDPAAAAVVFEFGERVPRTEREVCCGRHTWLDHGRSGEHRH
jgi:hypothetical protein